MLQRQPQPVKRMTPEQYAQLVRDWDRLPVQWNPQGVYGGIKEVRAPGRSFLYTVPALGAAFVGLAVFLPWFSITFFGANLSTNGIGALSAPPGFVDNMQKLSSQTSTLSNTTATGNGTGAGQPYEAWHGWVLITLAVIALVFCGLGILLKSKAFAIGPLFAGVICLGLGGLDLWRTYKLIGDNFKQVASTTPAQSAFLDVQTGFGLYLLVIASLAIVAGSISTLTLFYRGGESF